MDLTCARQKPWVVKFQEVAKMRGLKISAVLLSFLFAPASAQAAGKEASERAAKKACLLGDVAKGVDILTDLYIETNDPNYIFNQGRCYEQNMSYHEALARFREFLVKAVKASAEVKADAEKHIATCEAYIASSSPSSPQGRAVETAKPTVVEPAKPSPPANQEAAVGAQQQPVVLVQQASGAGQAGSGLRTAGVVAVGIGGAALVAGVLLNVKVNSMAHDLQAEGAYSRNKESQRATYQTLGWVGYGVGAACVATGALLYLLGRDRGGPTEPSVALVPAFAPGNVGATLKGSF